MLRKFHIIFILVCFLSSCATGAVGTNYTNASQFAASHVSAGKKVALIIDRTLLSERLFDLASIKAAEDVRGNKKSASQFVSRLMRAIQSKKVYRNRISVLYSNHFSEYELLLLNEFLVSSAGSDFLKMLENEIVGLVSAKFDFSKMNRLDALNSSNASIKYSSLKKISLFMESPTGKKFQKKMEVVFKKHGEVYRDEMDKAQKRLEHYLEQNHRGV